MPKVNTIALVFSP